MAVQIGCGPLSCGSIVDEYEQRKAAQRNHNDNIGSALFVHFHDFDDAAGNLARRQGHRQLIF